MVFRQQTPGDFEHYVYAGQSKDIGAIIPSSVPGRPVTDEAGHVYVGGEEYIEEYDPAQPSSPICSFKAPSAQISTMTVDPSTGAPFYYSAKDRQMHQLSPCNGEGEFVETGNDFNALPPRDNLSALAFDPLRQISPSRPPGALYGAAPEPVTGNGKGEPGKTSIGYIFAPVEESPPVVESESVSDIGTKTASLHARIDPTSFKTHYVFQYITDGAYEEAGKTFAGAQEAPAGGGFLASGQGPTSVAVTLIGLAAGTGYHYRVVAESNCSPGELGKVCEVAGADQTFRTFPEQVAGPPDNRAYELVSPAQKNGGQVLPADPTVKSCPTSCKPGFSWRHFPMQSTADGETIVYEGAPFAASGGGPIENEYISRRGASGWSTVNLTPQLMIGGGGYMAFDSSLTRGVIWQVAQSLGFSAPSEYSNLYLQSTAASSTLVPAISEDPLNHTPFNRSPNPPGRFEVFYAGASDDLSRVFFAANDALTEATPFAPEAIDGGSGKTNLYEWAGGKLSLVNVAPENTSTAPGAIFAFGLHAISADGSRVFWSSEAGQLFARIDGTETVEIEDPGKFVSASPDGSRILLSDGCLYDLGTKTCEDLTGGEGGFQGLSGQSEDLSRVYFVDTAVLTGEEVNGEGDKALAGQNNLYAWEGGSTSFVATLSSEDGAAWVAAPPSRMAEASPNGSWLAFRSVAPLTGYDNNGPCKVTSEGTVTAPCKEVFLYDSEGGELSCPSCRSTTSRPAGSSTLRIINVTPLPLDQPRYLTNSGRLYFDTQNPLVAADTNGNVEDVYQVEPEGIGTCKLADGCVSLVSAGRNRDDSNFLAMDASGANVFFTTTDKLVVADTDELYDLYDARSSGGFPPQSELPPSEPVSPPVPPKPLPTSPTFFDPGNVNPKPCKKGQVKRKGKCVKKPKHQKQNNQSKKNKKHARGGAK